MSARFAMVLVVVVTSVVLAGCAGTPPAPAPTSSPAAAPPSSAAPSAAPSAAATSPSPAADAGRPELADATGRVEAATRNAETALNRDQSHPQTLRADFESYQSDVTRYRSEVVAAPTSGTLRTQVETELLPAVDKVLVDLREIVTATSREQVNPAAARVDGNIDAMLSTGKRLSAA